MWRWHLTAAPALKMAEGPLPVLRLTACPASRQPADIPHAIGVKQHMGVRPTGIHVGQRHARE